MDDFIRALTERFHLEPLPGEGGLYTESYRSALWLGGGVLPEDYRGTGRPAATAIYYLLTAEADSFSALHRLPGDELYHFYLGDAVELLLLDPAGEVQHVLLGQDVLAGQEVQVRVPGECWQGARLRPGGRYALLGTTMAPGFDFADYIPGERAALCVAFPAERERILALTRG